MSWKNCNAPQREETSHFRMDTVEYQKRVLVRMARIYCRAHHGKRGDGNGLCPQCLGLVRYAEERLSKCPFGSGKPNCSSCRVHCYRQDMRDGIKTVMRYSGPRMILHHPLDALVYLYRKISRGKK